MGSPCLPVSIESTCKIDILRDCNIITMEEERMSKNKSRGVTLWCTLLLFSIIGCAPIVISPHAQNEMVVPYNHLGEVQEVGVTSAANAWLHEDEAGTVYLRTYPAASFSLFHNAYYGWGKFSGIGGMEIIGFPSTWLVSDAPGAIIAFRPFAGFQYDTDNFTVRLNLAPLTYAVGIGGGEWIAGGDLNEFTFYQLSAMVHNTYPAGFNYWLGARHAPAALGPIAGCEYAFSDKTFFRTEASFLFKPPVAIFLEEDALDRMEGSVFYATFGVFYRVR